ncbi:MAG: UTP--glucose-1-phosphate uridylyltransferase GalU [Methylicorpusculum sp.]|uniref:UTP--glucose-1-phosphate uridylyltransferase GalU n=1 Tax=Methylicorpusculum sp. TaxID=2713644 RepID=UPI00271E992A|nr:UTP--glucose-1-phosphate uridylyltransferase GalU [Methylicorpusculum sp.]MDO8845961.1 UTP--glucose-1-phosphate uridylyltransferase GalU [Methylicorpusculum sp.]MDO8938551.1 UTP--glucose-1-phosphate uridylyltransferase GalU [Methylicorpusculum sp.]MDO9242072.1 UTP--glucose-1-phosphate uridylyltransferase GalU [Methylicorpusculum sp.]MDP2202101.1 UTP--glucose-1-phosphate uridylyltransferase GalU [Methylicorpusculum sp.]
MKQIVTKAVFPVAGLGTRFLPATKASPKEMLPVVDKPLIQYAVEEAVAAGIDTMIFVTGRTKNSIMDHFDKAYELEKELESKNKTELLKILQNIVPPHISCVFIRQSEALGLGHAVYCARPIVGDEPFAVILADDLIYDKNRGCMRQMVELYHQQHCSILGVERVAPSETGSYGIVKTEDYSGTFGRVDLIVEKPKPEVAPSNLAVVGRYILTPAIFDKIKNTQRGAGGEIQLTDAIASLLADERVLAFEFEGKRYDCGSKLGFLTATVELGLLHKELKEDFAVYLKNLAKTL